MRCDPANTIIEKFGGSGAVASITGRAQQTVLRWAYPKERGGTGGVIPYPYVQTLLRAAKERRIKLREADFFPTEAAQ